MAYIAKIYRKQEKIPILELFAGDGRITQKLPLPNIAVEKESHLIQKGTEIAPKTKWIQQDLINYETIHKFIYNHKETYEIIIANPPWEYTFWTIVMSQHLLKDIPTARLILLIPSDYFVSTENKRKLFKKLNIKIERQYQVGRWNYLEDLPTTNARIGTDSIFVLKINGNTTSSLTYTTEWLTSLTHMQES